MQNAVVMPNSAKECVEALEVRVGSSCNNHCIYCEHENKAGVYPDKGTEEIKMALREFGGQSQDVIFTGGEPTIRGDMCELVRCARETGYSEIHVRTNGRMFANKKFCRDMVKAGANGFHVTLNGHKGLLHNYITGAGSFMETIKGIINLKSLGQTVKINCVVTKPNYRHLPEAARLFVKLGADAFCFSFVRLTGRALKNYLSVVPRMALAAPYVKEGLRIGHESGMTAFAEGIPCCIMNGYSDCITEKASSREQSPAVCSYTGTDAHDDGQTKRDACASCIYDSVCGGLRKEYVEFFGWDEFVPVESGTGPIFP